MLQGLPEDYHTRRWPINNLTSNTLKIGDLLTSSLLYCLALLT